MLTSRTQNSQKTTRRAETAAVQKHSPSPRHSEWVIQHIGRHESPPPKCAGPKPKPKSSESVKKGTPKDTVDKYSHKVEICVEEDEDVDPSRSTRRSKSIKGTETSTEQDSKQGKDQRLTLGIQAIQKHSTSHKHVRRNEPKHFDTFLQRLLGARCKLY